MNSSANHLSVLFLPDANLTHLRSPERWHTSLVWGQMNRSQFCRHLRSVVLLPNGNASPWLRRCSAAGDRHRLQAWQACVDHPQPVADRTHNERSTAHLENCEGFWFSEKGNTEKTKTAPTISLNCVTFLPFSHVVCTCYVLRRHTVSRLRFQSSIILFHDCASLLYNRIRTNNL